MKRIPVETKVFVDSNVLVYTVGPDLAKAQRANEIMDLQPLVTVQVLNEFVNVTRKKLKLDWIVVRDGLEHITE